MVQTFSLFPPFFLFFFTESEKSKDWEQQISQMKQAFEKQLQCERTLKTQASLLLNISKVALDILI